MDVIVFVVHHNRLKKFFLKGICLLPALRLQTRRQQQNGGNS
jgi:hypothetical protein